MTKDMKIAFVTNLLTPYRIVFCDAFREECLKQGADFRVYAMASEISGRPWKYEEYAREYTRLLPSKTIRINGIEEMHINPGVRRFVKEYAPDVIIMAGAYLEPTVMHLTFMAKRKDFKTVFWSESHDGEQRSYRTPLLKIRERVRKEILGRMNGFWYPGQKAESFLEHYANKQAVMIRVPNSVDNGFWGIAPEKEELRRVRESISPVSGQKILFTPARLAEAKGLLPFCEIISRLPSSKYVWLIAGDGPLQKQLEAEITGRGLSARLLGHKTEEQIREYYYSADALVLPSVSDPNPLSCVEALWCGLPLFVSENVGNYPETVIQGENGYVFSHEAPASASKMLEELLNKDSGWFDKARKISRRIAENEFSLDRIAERAFAETADLRDMSMQRTV